MVRRYYNKEYQYKFQKHIIVDNNKKPMKMFEVNIIIKTNLMYLLKKSFGIKEIKISEQLSLKYTFAI